MLQAKRRERNGSIIHIPEETGLLTKELYFLWLLRSDVREKLLDWKASEIEAKKEFIAWWLMFGRKEYPENARFNEDHVSIAREIVGERGGLKITRMMRFLLWAREDVGRLCESDTENGINWPRFVRWYYVYGVPQYDMFPFLNISDIEYLGSPEPDIAQDTSMPISRLMYGLWAWQSDLQAAFPLKERLDRERYLAWFYIYGLKQCRYFEYIGLRSAVRLCEPVPHAGIDNNPPVTRLMWYLWLADNEIRGKVDINSKVGRTQLTSLLYEKLYSKSDLRPLWNILDSRRQPVVGGMESRLVKFPSTKESFQRKSSAMKFDGDSFGVNLVGYAMGELGIGEDVRMMARALEAAGIPFCILNRQPGKEIRQLDFSMVRYLVEQPRYPITMVCMTAFDTATLWLDRPDIFHDTYTIGCWPWELPSWPSEWNAVYELVDEVWSSSQYTFEAFAKNAPIPVIHMPMVVTIDSLTYCERSRFGLPDDRFLYLFVFDFMSYPARKNPEACMEAFLLAFPGGDEPVNLVLKVSNVVHDSPLWRKIEEARLRDPRIIILDMNLDKGVVLGLIRVCDVYISLHRAEGFGRTLAEAMLLEKPVVATAYSGNSDYLNETTGIPVPYSMAEIGLSEYPCGVGQVWAEPDTASAAEKLKEVFLDCDAFHSRAIGGRKYISDNYSPKTVGGRVIKRLEALSSKLPRTGSRKTMP